jgi:hypothetical protein
MLYLEKYKDDKQAQPHPGDAVHRDRLAKNPVRALMHVLEK